VDRRVLVVLSVGLSSIIRSWLKQGGGEEIPRTLRHERESPRREALRASLVVGAVSLLEALLKERLSNKAKVELVMSELSEPKNKRQIEKRIPKINKLDE